MKKSYLVVVLIIAILVTVAFTGCSKPEAPENATTEEATQETAEKVLDGYPSKIIEVLVGYAAGGDTDLDARKMVELLQTSGLMDKSVNFNVVNKPGAGGAMPVRELATSKKSDDHTLLVDTAHINSLWNGGAGKDTSLSDLKPIAQIGESTLMIMVKEDSKYKTLDDLLNALKNDSKSVVISLSTPLLSGECWVWDRVKNAAGVNGQLTLVTHNGASESLVSLLAGDADVALLFPILVKDHVSKGTLKPLAIFGENRLDDFPDTPTMIENGFDVTFIKAKGVLMGGEVSEEIINYWENILKKMTETDEWKEHCQRTGQSVIFKGSEEYTNFINKQGSAYQEYFLREQENK